MAFSSICTNKGCGKQMEPYIDPKEDKVYCSLCDKEILNLTFFAKNQMKSTKQYKQKSTVSFMIKCTSCNKEDRPKLIGKDPQEVICPHCRKPHAHLSEPFKIMLREKLKTVAQDV